MSRLSDLLATAKQTGSVVDNSIAPGRLVRITKPVFHLFCKILYTIYCPLSAQGQENLPKSPFIICSNHSSHMDTTALIHATKLPYDRFSALAAQDYFFNTKKKSAFSTQLLNLIPVSRTASRKSLQESIALCAKHLKLGHNLIIYPEGTRSTDGNIHEFKNGAALIATQLELPIVPAYIAGTYQAMPKGRHFIKPRKITVKFASPISTALATNNAKLHYQQITDQMLQAIIQLKESTVD